MERICSRQNIGETVSCCKKQVSSLAGTFSAAIQSCLWHQLLPELRIYFIIIIIIINIIIVIIIIITI